MSTAADAPPPDARVAVVSVVLRGLFVGALLGALAWSLGGSLLVVGGLAAAATVAGGIVERACGVPSSGARSAAIALAVVVAAGAAIGAGLLNLAYVQHRDDPAAAMQAVEGEVEGLRQYDVLPYLATAIALSCVPLGLSTWHRNERERRRGIEPAVRPRPRWSSRRAGAPGSSPPVELSLPGVGADPAYPAVEADVPLLEAVVAAVPLATVGIAFVFGLSLGLIGVALGLFLLWLVSGGIVVAVAELADAGAIWIARRPRLEGAA